MKSFSRLRWILAFHIWFLGVTHAGKIAVMPLPTRELGNGNRPVTNGLASEPPTTGVFGAASAWPRYTGVLVSEPLPRSPGLEPMPPLPGAKNMPYPARNTVFRIKVHARPTRGAQSVFWASLG